MISQFLQQQMDYISFCYGLSFILLAFVCHSLRKEPGQRLPWIWLGLFAIAHGINEWLDMLAAELGDGWTFSVVRLSLMTLSFVLLLEFGRDGSRRLRGKGPGRWIHLPLLAAVVAGGLAGLSGLNATARYACGLTGGLWAALTLFHAARDDNESRRLFTQAAILMACYALTTGVIVPKSSFFPASIVNKDAFLSLTGTPIQPARGILALLITFSLWIYFERVKMRGMPESGRIEKEYVRNRTLFTMVMVFILLMGLIFAELVRRDADQDVRSDLLNITRMIAASLAAEEVKPLTGAVSDAQLPTYHLLRSQLLDMGYSNPQFRWLYLMSLRDGKILFTVDSVPTGVYGHGEPGEKGTLYEQPPRELFGVFTGGEAITVGPYRDEWGSFLSGFGPIREGAGGHVVGVLGIDMDASRWHGTITKYRLASICITLLVALMAIGFFTTNLRAMESAQRLAVSEARYRSLFENMVEGFAYCRMLFVDGRADDFIYLKVNKVFETLTGLKNVTGKRASEVIPGIRESDPALIETYGRVAQTGTPERFETYVTSLDMWFSLAVYCPEKEHVVVVFDVITERKQAEERLRKSESNFRATFEQAAVGMAIVGLDGSWLKVNQKLCDIVGYTREELLRRSFQDITLSEDLEASLRYLRRLKDGEIERFSMEKRYVKKDGSLVWINLAVRTVRTPAGVPEYSLSIVEDINERKQAELELKNLHKRIEFVLGVTRTGLDIIDAEFNMVYIDPEWQKVYGDYRGRKCYEYFADRKAMCPNCGIPEALRVGKPMVTEEELPKEGNRRVQVTTIPFQNEEGAWLVAEVNVDITERRKAEQALQESENRFRQVAESAEEWIWETDAEGLYRYSSRAVEKILGYSPDELVGHKHFYDLFDPAVRDELKAGAMAAFEGRQAFRNFINPNLHKKGTMVLLETSGSPILDEQGNLLGYRGTDTDITARRRAEEALREREEYYLRLLEVSPDGITVIDLQGNLTYVSPKSRAMFGIPAAAALRGTPALNWFTPAYRVKMQDRMREMVTGQPEAGPTVYQLLRHDGTWFWGEIISATIHDAAGRPTGIMSLIRDITERRRTEEALRENEEKYRLLFDRARDAILVLDLPPDGLPIIRDANAESLRMLGYSLDELVGKPVSMMEVSGDSEAMFMERRRRAQAVDGGLFTVRHQRKDGSVFDAEASVKELTIGGRRLSITVERDITERKRAEEEVRSARAFLDSIINAIADPVFVKDAARRFVLVNDALCEIVGRPRDGLIGQDGDDLFPREQVEVFRKVDFEVLDTGAENVNEESLSNLSTGEVRTIVTRKSLVVDPGGKRFLVGVIRDFTERKRAEEERERLIAELREAMSKVKTLSGFLPICANCKKIRDDKGYWNQIESYIRDHSEAEFSHGICPDCQKKFFPDYSGE